MSVFYVSLYRLENSELQLKSDVASTRLRYEQQVKTLSGELTSMQVCALKIFVTCVSTSYRIF